jgi:hypothetical protein
VQIDGVTYIEQNKMKETIYAQMANQVRRLVFSPFPIFFT